MLTGVTLTGADDSVKPGDLMELSREFPFVEWGLLIGSEDWTPRFPSSEWWETLGDELRTEPQDPRLSLHLCGPWRNAVADIGVLGLPHGLPDAALSRIQLNFHGVPRGGSSVTRDTIIRNIGNVSEAWGLEVIVQLDTVNDWLLPALTQIGASCSGLFDVSHGAGITPDTWSKPDPDHKYGYAGGLGPDNVADQVRAIERVAGGQPFWIDMETKLRSDGGAVFDLALCRRALEATAGFIR